MATGHLDESKAFWYFSFPVFDNIHLDHFTAAAGIEVIPQVVSGQVLVLEAGDEQLLCDVVIKFLLKRQKSYTKVLEVKNLLISNQWRDVDSIKLCEKQLPLK